MTHAATEARARLQAMCDANDIHEAYAAFPNHRATMIADVRVLLASTPTPAGELREVDEKLQRELTRFQDAKKALPWVVEACETGKQFNAYDSASNDEDDDDDDRDMYVGIGPVTDFRFLASVTGAKQAALIEAALRLADVASRALPQPGSGEGV